jgi:hypothetical protein
VASVSHDHGRMGQRWWSSQAKLSEMLIRCAVALGMVAVLLSCEVELDIFKFVTTRERACWRDFRNFQQLIQLGFLDTPFSESPLSKFSDTSLLSHLRNHHGIPDLTAICIKERTNKRLSKTVIEADLGRGYCYECKTCQKRHYVTKE